MAAGPAFFIGRNASLDPDDYAQHSIAAVREGGYDFVTIEITNAKYFQAVTELVKTAHSSSLGPLSTPPVPAITADYTDLAPGDVTTFAIAYVSSWADVTSSDPVIQHVSRQVIGVEVAYAAFCGILHVVLPPVIRDGHGLARGALARYASTVSQVLNVGPYLHLLLPLPMDDQRYADAGITELPHSELNGTSSVGRSSTDTLSPWDAWHYIRSASRYTAKLSIVLAIPRLLPAEHIQSRWFSEPIRILDFHESTFPINQRGYPVLSKVHQALIYKFVRLQPVPWMLLSGMPIIDITDPIDPTPAESAKLSPRTLDTTPHLTYLRHLQVIQPDLPPLARFAQGYQDFLQSPLQPLTDNLESITYEVFEKDPIKYDWYERAIAVALRDLSANLQRPIVLAVVGAGRGPLMTRSLLASKSTGVPIIPYAIEKNPNAYVLLQRHNKNNPLWGGRVQVVKTDMRAWKGPTTSEGQSTNVDIFVSELLGSFADNELSPECLDGAQHLLDPNHGISIPQSYTAWVTPISSPRIHSDLLHRPSSDRDTWHLSYVSMLHQFAYLSYTDESLPPDATHQLTFQPSIQRCWEFSHPIPALQAEWSQRRRNGGAYAPGLSGGDGWNQHNIRSCNLTFSIPEKGRGVCHGLAGYFETVLYHSPETGEKVELSTNPNTMDAKSKDMISWFPIFFPIKTPVNVPDGAEVEVSMERKTDDRKVWYEWKVDVWIEVGGVRQQVAGSEVHGSKETGCLM